MSWWSRYSWKAVGGLLQYAGRILRPHGGKATADDRGDIPSELRCRCPASDQTIVQLGGVQSVACRYPG